MTARLKIVSLLGVGLIAMSACTPQVATTIPATPVSVKIKVGVPSNLSNAAFFIAQDEGYFAAQGLEVKFVSIPSSSQVAPLLVSGDIDVLAGAVSTSHLNAIAQGANLKVVADKGHYEPGKCSSMALVLRPGLFAEHPINSPADLKGIIIGANPTTHEGYTYESLLAQGGLTLDDVQIKTLSSSQLQLAAFDAGQLDMVSLLEPTLTTEVLAGKAVVWRTGDQVTPDKQIAYVIFGPGLVDQNPEAGKRFILAYLKGVHQYNQGATERNLDIVAKYTQVDRAILKQACWQYIADDGQIDTASIVRFEDWAVKKKLMDSAATVDQFWDPRFITYANQVLAGQ